MFTARNKAMRPVEISLWGNPQSIDLDRCETHLQIRAQRFYDAIPERKYYWDTASHDQLSRMNIKCAFTGSVEHPRSHAYNSHSYTHVDGPGPHGLLLYRDWHEAAPIRGPRQFRFIPAGTLILPNMGDEVQQLNPDQRETMARLCWELWEQSTGTGQSAALRVRQVLSAARSTEPISRCSDRFVATYPFTAPRLRNAS
ncbi:hypothetical protein GCM10011385_07650 [Nitratireductor aestuarii]|uniref:Uncharacterized protein n=1 Tax=Nitratireductor aestuarii TaxID=1735103 RepID=A0A916W0L3_9HYPH|nr:hypothetical protein [Nitratireductor aestuarii]GGA56617.1 hypothetical protein GCM10011385_07650 [Nitratireductor aestuarii]